MSTIETMDLDIRRLTNGPKFHWFGYYDKFQFDPSDRYVLCMETDFEGRSPEAEDTIRVGMIDLEKNNEWIELGQTSSWCWQQGCMLQWIPGSPNEIIYNDRDGDSFCAHIMNVETRTTRSIPTPVYTLSPDGKTALSLDFKRTGRLRPGYGYAGTDPSQGTLAPEECGVYNVDLQTGDSELIISIAQAAAIPTKAEGLSSAEQWFNACLISPDSERFIFLHRWGEPDANRISGTRMFTANLDGSDIRLLHDGGLFSHFIWRDPDHILAWADRPESGNAFYLINEKKGSAEAVGIEAMTVDGHVTYLPGNEWIVNDSYALKGDRNLKQLYLFHPACNRRIDLGPIRSFPEYTGEWRCDLHPRRSRSGNLLTIDSVHEGLGRQLYFIDISHITSPC